MANRTTRRNGRFALVVLLALFATATSGSNAQAISGWFEGQPVALREANDGAWLGIWLGRVSSSVRKRYHLRTRDGVFVVDVVDDSPADRAGIRRHDVILSFDGERVRGPEDLSLLLEEYRPGDKVKIVIERRGKRKTLDVVLGRKPKTPFHRVAPLVPKFLKRAFLPTWLGVELQGLNPDLAHYFKLKEPRGALITSVEPGSPADEAGLKAGDVIVEIDGQEINTPDDVAQALQDFESGDTVTITVIRDGRRKSFDVELEGGSWESNFYLTPKGLPESLRKQLEALQRSNLELQRRLQKENFQDELNRKLERLQDQVKELQKRIEKMQKEFESLRRSR